MLDRRAWLSVSALIHPKRCSIGLTSGLYASQSSASTPNSVIHVFMGLASSYWNRKRPSPNCSYKVRSMELSSISWYAEAFRVPFTGIKGPSPAPEKQPHTIIHPPPNFTPGTMQSDKYCSPGNHQVRFTGLQEWGRDVRTLGRGADLIRSIGTLYITVLHVTSMLDQQECQA